MKRRKRRRNPENTVEVLAWAAGSAVVAGLVTYYIGREIAMDTVMTSCGNVLGDLDLRNKIKQTANALI